MASGCSPRACHPALFGREADGDHARGGSGYGKASLNMMEDQLADSKNEDGLSNFGALRERVGGIDKRLVEIVERLDKLTDAVHDGGKTKWGELVGFASIISLVLGGLWLLVIIPIKDDIKDLKAGTMSVKEEIAREIYVDKELSRLESDLKDKATKDDLNRLIIEIDRRLPKPRDR